MVKKFLLSIGLLAAMIVVLMLMTRGEKTTKNTNSAFAEKTEQRYINSVNLDAKGDTSSALNQPKVLHKKGKSETLMSRADELIACIDSDSCHYPDSDPRSYGYALGNDMISVLNDAEMAFSNGEINADLLRDLSHRFFIFDNGHVRAKAIKILEKLPVDGTTFELLQHTFANHYDSVLLEKSMHLLETYYEQGYSQPLDALFLQQLQTGAHFVRHTLSEKILPFINSNNLADYQQILSQMPKDSLEFRQLEVALEEFNQLAQGG